jgi:hypothetical protein
MARAEVNWKTGNAGHELEKCTARRKQNSNFSREVGKTRTKKRTRTASPVGISNSKSELRQLHHTLRNMQYTQFGKSSFF